MNILVIDESTVIDLDKWKDSEESLLSAAKEYKIVSKQIENKLKLIDWHIEHDKNKSYELSLIVKSMLRALDRQKAALAYLREFSEEMEGVRNL